MIYIVTDNTGEQREVILVTVSIQYAYNTAESFSKPGEVNPEHEGGLHEVFELDPEEVYLPNLEPIASFENGERV